MVKLKDVIASVLRDVLIAQHEANLLSESLKSDYEKGPLARFCAPKVSLGEMELTFHYSIQEGEAGSDDPGNLSIIVDTERLAQLPAEAVQQITLTVNPQAETKDDE